MDVTFELRTDRPDADGRCAVRLVARFDNHRLRIATPERCNVKQWDAGEQKFRRSFPGYQDANDFLQSEAERVQQAYRRLRSVNIHPTPALIREALAPPVVAVSPPLIEAFDEFRATLAGRGFRYHTTKLYGTARDHLAAFVSLLPEPLRLAEYTMAQLEDFLDYLRVGAGMSHNTVACTVKNLKPFLTWARDTRGLALGVEPGKLRVDWEDVEKAWLTAPELAALERTLLPDSLMKVRDSFLFCCYTGLRYSDLADMHAGNVQDWEGSKVLRLTQTKTRTAVSIYLTPPALALLAKYDGTRAHLLPVMVNAAMNRCLKRIAKLAGVDKPVEVVETIAGRIVKRCVEKCELVTCHSARHTFAVQSILRGMPIVVLQKVLGHANIQTTMVYVRIVEDFQHHEMRRVWEGAPMAAAATAESGAGICEVAPAA